MATGWYERASGDCPSEKPQPLRIVRKSLTRWAGTRMVERGARLWEPKQLRQAERV